MDIKEISFYPTPVTIGSNITTSYTIHNTGDTIDVCEGNFTFFDSNKKYYGNFKIPKITLHPGESKDLFHNYFIRMNSPTGAYYYSWTLNVVGDNIKSNDVKKTIFPVFAFYVNPAVSKN